MSRLGRVLALSGRRRRLLVLALALSVLVRAGLVLASFDRVRTVLDRVPASGSVDLPNGSASPSIDDLRWATVVASRRVPGAACLTRALVAGTLCRRYGHPAAIRVGVDPGAESLAAHSWVTSRDRVVVGDDVDLDRYEPLGTLDAVDRP